MRAAFLLLALLAAVPTATAATQTLFPYNDAAGAWTYKVVGFGGEAGFQNPAYDDSTWTTAPGPFSSSTNYCSLPTRRTAWPLNTDLVVRRDVFLPAGTTGVVIGAAIDNDITVYWNGVLLTQTNTGGCTFQDRIVLNVPDASVQQDNVLAFRGHDYGALSYFDARLTATLPDAAPPVPELGSVLLVTAGLVGVAAMAFVRRR